MISSCAYFDLLKINLRSMKSVLQVNYLIDDKNVTYQ